MIDIKKFEKIPDSEITSRVLSGDTAMYEIIIRRYNPYLFKIGRSYGFNQPDTEDLMQETFINAYTNLNNFEHRSSLKTWMVRIMLNNCYHKKRKFSYKNEFPSDSIENSGESPMFNQKPSNTSKTVMNNELRHILENAILQIPENYRMVFTLRELNAMSTKETAHALDISESNVKVRLKRAKSMLQTEIKKMYSPEEIFEFNLIYCNRIVENVFNRLPQKSKSAAFSNLINLKKWLLGFMNGRA
ncbi:sigma-70 family RNA polymerase sigma factor [Gramella jeungdoensis]|uniref:Sigma-70 family RNA polymerase sigma factor n=1 Tax=Gramella jeungdoensis TaxID=708091 RepID=A0ABT0Z4X7_9FLAO|nr:sigma-70 family RNA polymerase sigma factor [Gramella jeungdoensis]MCM8569819.1 sigma-70 family RNA polymerase sigma factor [Gramella jeungdoensis]